ncbi:hypothetical protein OROMI_007819 [Orobanche minor]
MNDKRMKNIPFTSDRVCSRIWKYIETIKVEGKQRFGFWNNAENITHLLGIKMDSRIFRKVSMVRWLKPPIGWMKLNTDGAARGNPGLAAAGGIVRDPSGKPFLCFWEFIGFQSNTIAELHGIWRGLQLCFEKGMILPVVICWLIMLVDSSIILSLGAFKMSYCFITGSATIISNSFGNPPQKDSVLCENTDSKKTLVNSSLHKNVSYSSPLIHPDGKKVDAGNTHTGKTQLVICDEKDADLTIPNTRSTETIEGSTKKETQNTRSDVSSTPVLGVDLGCFIFPEAVSDFVSKKSSDRISSQGGSAKVSSDPGVVSGSPLTLGAMVAKDGVPAQIGPDVVGSNLLRDPISSNIPVVPAPVANKILEGSAPAFGLPSGSVNPVCAADLRRAVSSEVWARFPEAVWKDAAVIASEILKLPPPARSGGSPIPQVGKGMDPLIPSNNSNNFSPNTVLTGASVVPTVPPVVKPVTPSDPSANGPDPKAPTFAALVSNDPASVERIGSTDFSGFLPTAVFTKKECESVSAVYKNALIGKFSFGKPDNFAIANCLFNAGFGKYKVQFLNSKHVLISLQYEDAYTRLWLKREFIASGYPMRLFKWDPFFDFKQEPALVPIWVKIMALPLQWFDQGALQTIGSLMGTFLKADPMTINRSRLITLGFDFEVEYEKLPSFCHHCQHIGHDIDACYIKNPSLKPHTFTNKFLESGKNQLKERDRSQWYTVGKGKKVTEASVSGVKNNEVGLPPLVTNVSVKNAGAISDNDTLVSNNGFAALESLVEEDPRPPPAGSNVISEEIGSQGHVRTGLASPKSQNAHKIKGSVNPEPEVNVFSAIPPHNSPPPFVLGDCNLSGAGEVPVLFIFDPLVGMRRGRLTLKPIGDHIRIALTIQMTSYCHLRRTIPNKRMIRLIKMVLCLILPLMLLLIVLVLLGTHRILGI